MKLHRHFWEVRDLLGRSICCGRFLDLKMMSQRGCKPKLHSDNVHLLKSF